jgi:chemotaxis regulatin CheY-phosphate phosphatase CheZ
MSDNEGLIPRLGLLRRQLHTASAGLIETRIGETVFVIADAESVTPTPAYAQALQNQAAALPMHLVEDFKPAEIAVINELVAKGVGEVAAREAVAYGRMG